MNQDATLLLVPLVAPLGTLPCAYVGERILALDARLFYATIAVTTLAGAALPHTRRSVP